MGLNALKSLRRQAFGERSEDFHGAESREGNGIGKAGVTPAQSKIMVEK